jgi:ankyrin repeat protein
MTTHVDQIFMTELDKDFIKEIMPNYVETPYLNIDGEHKFISLLTDDLILSILKKYPNDIMLNEKPLDLACKINDLEKAKELLTTKSKFDLLGKNAFNVTPLHIAADNKNLDMIKLLVENGADIYAETTDKIDGVENFQEKIGQMPIHWSIDNNDLKSVEYFLSLGIPVDQRDIYGYSFIVHAMWADNMDLVKYFISKGCDINARGYSGETVLHRAFHSKKMIDDLVALGADINILDNYGNSPMDTLEEDE